MTKDEDNSYLKSIEVFLKERWKLFSENSHESEEDRKKLTDVFLKFFKEKFKSNQVNMYEGLSYLCFVYSKFEEIIDILKHL